MNSHVDRPPRRPQRKRDPRLPVLLAMAVGLGGGLVLAGPLADLLSSQALGRVPSFSNPFAAWTGSIGRQELLLLGTDVGGGNTDVIATLHIEDGVTRITQIPRDTYIEVEPYGPMKINALYSVGGIDAVQQEVSRRLGRPIQHHVVVNLAAIRRMADDLGGIEVNVPKRMLYVDHSQGLSIDLQPGLQTLKGRDLEGFLRFRHDEMGDIGRLERQQLALKALFRKLTRPDQIVRLPALLMGSTNSKDIRTDLGPMELGGLITAMGTTKLDTQRLGGRPFWRDGISYWEADWPQLPGGEAGSTDGGAAGAGTATSGERGDRAASDRYRFLF